MIENFTPQPYPLRASFAEEPDSSLLVVGWRDAGDGSVWPVVVELTGSPSRPQWTSELLLYALPGTSEPAKARGGRPTTPANSQPA